MKIACLCGSLREDSYNKMLLEEMKKLAPENYDFVDLKISNVPLYNSDIQDQVGFPTQILKIEHHLNQCDALLIVTPEYNYSMPGVLKNAIDWISRLNSQPFNNLPVAIAGASPGVIGTARCQYHLRQSMVFLNAHVMNKPEVMLGRVHEKFNENGELIDQATKDHIKLFVENIEAWSFQLGWYGRDQKAA